MGKKEKNKKSENILVDDVNTTELNLKQLENYCVLVYKDLVRVELESRGLELERNKLKSMVDIANEQLNKSKTNLMDKKFQLGETSLKIILDELNEQNQIRNVKVENSKAMLLAMEDASQNMESVQEESSVFSHELECDLKSIKDKIIRLEINKNQQTIKLKRELEQEKSNLIHLFEIDNKLQASQYEKKGGEMQKKISKENLMALQNFDNYKIRKINEFLRNTDKSNTALTHYYEKLTQHNINVLNGKHESHQSEKDYIGKMKKVLKVHREAAEMCKNEMENNCNLITELNDKLVHSKRDKRELMQIKRTLMMKQNHLKCEEMENLLLEEAMKLTQNNAEQRFEKKKNSLLSLQNKITQKLMILECWENKINTRINKMNYIIESATNKDTHLTLKEVKEIVFAELEKEAHLEMMAEKRAQRLSSRYSSQNPNIKYLFP